MSTSAPLLPAPALRVLLGRADELNPGLQLLGGAPTEALFPDARPLGRHGEFAVFDAGDWILGSASLPAGEALEESAFRLYRDLVGAAGDRTLARVWNYVPAINEPRADGLENYRAFCRGRAAAFESAWGPGFKLRVPAASAVGCQGADLTVVFAASRRPTRYVENPAQVPAYDYPRQHGPRAPSFARAAVATRPDGSADVFVSGTAAIRGHVTCAPEHTAQQVGCTLDNLRLVSGTCGLGDDLGAGRATRRHFKVYLRDATDFRGVAATLQGELFRRDDQVSYVLADICRRELNVEIEASLFGVT